MSSRRVVVVGAGLSGLMAARRLAVEGCEVTVLDKGRGPGGRLATRRVTTPAGTARFDHGAQFFTVRSDRFAAVVDGWRADGVVREWCRGFATDEQGHPDGHPRFVGVHGMNDIAKHLARDLDVRTGRLVFALRPAAAGSGSAWSVDLDDGSGVPADAVVLTTPLPQAFALLVTADVELPERLIRTEYDRCLGLLAAVAGDTRVPEPGGAQDADPVFSFIGDNQAKGVSEEPAVTFHANPAWSEAHWDDEADAVHRTLLDEAARWLGDATLVASQAKRWRFAKPRSVWPEPCWTAADGAGPLVLAGDAFAGPKVTGSNMEGAALSGLAAAESLLRHLP